MVGFYLNLAYIPSQRMFFATVFHVAWSNLWIPFASCLHSFAKPATKIPSAIAVSLKYSAF